MGDCKHDWTLCTAVTKISDIADLLKNDKIVNEIKSHDKVVIACGHYNLANNENGRQVATSLLKMAEKITEATGLEVGILGIPPTHIRPGQALLCNTRLAKMPELPSINFISLSKLENLEKSKVPNGSK